MVPVDVPDLPWLVKPIKICVGDCSHPYGVSLCLAAYKSFEYCWDAPQIWSFFSVGSIAKEGQLSLSRLNRFGLKFEIPLTRKE